jgi:hypothetical protein
MSDDESTNDARVTVRRDHEGLPSSMWALAWEMRASRT